MPSSWLVFGKDMSLPKVWRHLILSSIWLKKLMYDHLIIFPSNCFHEVKKALDSGEHQQQLDLTSNNIQRSNIWSSGIIHTQELCITRKNGEKCQETRKQTCPEKTLIQELHRAQTKQHKKNGQKEQDHVGECREDNIGQGHLRIFTIESWLVLQSRLRRLREHRATCCRLMIFRSLLSHSRIGTNCRILDLFMQDPYFQNHAEFLHLHTVGEFSVQNRDSILWGCAFRTRIPHYGAAVTWILTSRSLDSIYITT